MKGFSTGEGARVLGIKMDRLTAAINRSDCPDASMRIGGKRVFTLDDLYAIRRWYQARGKTLNNLDHLETAGV